MVSDKLKVNLLIIANGIVFLFFLVILRDILSHYYYSRDFIVLTTIILSITISLHCIYLLYFRKYDYTIPLIYALFIFSLWFILGILISPSLLILGLPSLLASLLTAIFFLLKAKKENELSIFKKDFYFKSHFIKDSHELLSAFIKHIRRIMESDKSKVNLLMIIANGIVFLFFLFSLTHLPTLSLINSTNNYFMIFVAIICPLIFIFSFSCIYLLYSHKYNYATPVINAALIYGWFLNYFSILDKINVPIMIMDYAISFTNNPYLIQVLGISLSSPSLLTAIFFLLKAKKENELSIFENDFFSKSPSLKASSKFEDYFSVFIDAFDIGEKKNIDLFIELLDKKNIEYNKERIKEIIKEIHQEREAVFQKKKEESKRITELENRIKPLVEEKKKLEENLEDVLSKLKDKYDKKTISENSYNELCNKYSKQIQSIQARIDEEKILFEMEGKLN